ncbi:hypothetical protein RhiirC2_799330 [Rhizophagus irregularis]|uniref:Uncharacterized protein n=1 Tax=Rhizophagus irregularis TaxID=588596 RepID=A0A2N1M553_9GLOM|nr:hypothetical protein RhiirC2_799330 [Rhizophagus irregularis]
MTASDYCHIIKIAIFALDKIFSEENEITCKELCELYTKFNKMYTMSRQESYTENELNIFERKELTSTTSSMKFIRHTSSQDSENDFFIKIYDSVHLESEEILKSTGEFQGKEWFSNVTVIHAEDQGQDEESYKEPYEFALVRWFDIYPIEPIIYGYS